ncbi:hypothetical protein BD770DRAFT_375678 [Pilaira anomala]|nr:hypothetical protein BD770DRAFT_375678 [Pilaira anomala]
MNTTHDSKDWHTMSQAPLQTTPNAMDSLSSPKPSNSTFTAHTSSNNYNNNSNAYSQSESHTMQPSYNDQETDSSRLPGMTAHSQPGTPRPENNRQESYIYQQPTPFPVRNNVSVRGRTSLFANEIGPYFTPEKPFENLYSSDKTTLLSVRVQSKMDRGFFMAENDWTCYRRNYFQVSSVFSLHGFNHYFSMNNDPHQVQPIYIQMEGKLVPVQRFLLGISARVANSEKEIELIQHTPKRDKGPQFRPDPKPIAPGGNLSMSSVANSQNIVTFERVQFKTATANNGKRRAAQQYYVCMVELYAEIDHHELVKVAGCKSSPLVVRGRSPGHYADVGERQSLPPPTVTTGGDNMVPENSRQHVFSTYQKPPTSHTSPTTTTSTSNMSSEYPSHNQQQAPPPPPPPPSGYPYYGGYSHQYNNNTQQQQQSSNSNVSSPVSHPPHPSPYPHHTQVQNYAIHDANSHPESYSTNEFQNNNSNNEESKMMHHPFNMQQTGPIESPHSGYDWQRARYNSSSSSSSAPSPGQQTEGSAQQTYFSHSDARSSYSPTTPTYANSGRKYSNNAVPNLMNKQIV